MFFVVHLAGFVCFSSFGLLGFLVMLLALVLDVKV